MKTFFDRLLIFTLFSAGLILAVLAILFAISLGLSLLLDQKDAILQAIPDDPGNKDRIFVALVGIGSSLLTALLGVGVAIWTYVRSSAAALRAGRKQHTITILFQTRVSKDFQATNAARKAAFPVDQDITLDAWQAARHATAETAGSAARATELQNGADALQQLLNYYEFLAVGIAQGDLDEDLLRASIRGIMCNLVDDSRHMIAALRQNNPQTLEHLVDLYGRWRRDGAINHNNAATERPIPVR